jgi:TadE-like protein
MARRNRIGALVRWWIGRRRVRSPRGQSLVELALILPFLLTLAGGATDLARVYQAQLTLESAVRNAAEYVASTSADAAAAQADARRMVCLESRTIPGFRRGPGADGDASCLAPAITLSSFAVSSTALGATVKNPIGSTQIRATVDFQTLLPYPFIPSQLHLAAGASYSVVRGR